MKNICRRRIKLERKVNSNKITMRVVIMGRGHAGGLPKVVRDLVLHCLKK
jgi:hypothetical protein